MTSASRMTYAFSRDGAIPGSKRWSALTPTRVPANAVMLVGVCAAILTLPALLKVDINGTPVPLAFYAVTSIAVIGLYLAFAIPIYLRWRHGENFEVGSWTNGNKYKWMNPIAVAEIVIVSLYLMMPTTPGGQHLQRPVLLEVRQLRADRDCRSPGHPGRLVAGLGTTLVHRPQAHDRRVRARGLRGPEADGRLASARAAARTGPPGHSGRAVLACGRAPGWA